MSRATEDLMDMLHGLTAQQMIAELHAFRNGERRGPGHTDRETGEYVEGPVLPLPPALLTAVIKFLKDNGVDRAAREGGSLDQLAGLLPSEEEVDNLVNFPGRKG